MKTSLALSLLAAAIVVFAARRDGETRAIAAASEGRPVRILPTTSDQVDVLSALVAPERIVAMPEQALTWSRVAEDPAWSALPTFPRLRAEIALDYRPDLVLLSPFAEPDPVARLRELGLACVTLPLRHDLDDVIAAVLRIGELVGEETRAADLVAAIRRERAALEARPEKEPRLRALAYTNFGSGGWAAGRETTIDSVMRLAGLDNALADRKGHFEFRFEELLAVDPDLIVVSGSFGESEDAMAALLKSAPGLARAQAVIAGRILRLPPRLASAGSQEMVTAAKELRAEVERLRGAEARR